jgi:hypothetical protein
MKNEKRERFPPAPRLRPCQRQGTGQERIKKRKAEKKRAVSKVKSKKVKGRISSKNHNLACCESEKNLPGFQ